MDTPARRCLLGKPEFETVNVASKIFAIVAMATVLTLMASPAARAQSGATDFDLNLPNLVVLHYFSQVDLTVTTNLLRNALYRNAGYPNVNQGTRAGSGLNPDLGIDAVYDSKLGPQTAGSINLRLRNVFAVRGIGGPGRSLQVRVQLASDTGTHITDPGSTVAVGNPRVTISGRTGASVTIAPPGLTTPATGEYRLVLDLSGAKRAGTYSGIRLTLTVDNL